MVNEKALRTVEGKTTSHEAYLDLVHPIAHQVGDAAGELMAKVLWPVRATLWGLDKVLALLGPAWKEALEPVERGGRLQEPNPAVAVPLIRALEYTGHEAPLPQMFARLLATSMDSKYSANAHPAFVSILSELLPDEAAILATLRPGRTHKTRLRIAIHGSSVSSGSSSLFDEAGLQHPIRSGAYLVNLRRIGVITVDDSSDTFCVEKYNAKQIHAVATRLRNKLVLDGIRGRADSLERDMAFGKYDKKFNRTHNELRASFDQAIQLTPFGEMLHAACITGPLPEPSTKSPRGGAKKKR